MSAGESQRPDWLQRVLPAAVWPYRSFSTGFWEGFRIGAFSYISYETLCAAEYFLLVQKNYELCVLPDPGIMVIYLLASGGATGYFFLWRDYKNARLAHRRIACAYGAVIAVAVSASSTYISAVSSSLLPVDAWIQRAVLVHSVYPVNTAVLWATMRCFKWLPALTTLYNIATAE